MYLFPYSFEKDAEADKTKQNGEAKAVAENGYYNMKEMDNNSANERKEESENDRRTDTIDQRDERREDDRDRRDRDYRDSPRRDYPRDYPRGSPRDRHPRDYRRDYSPRTRARSGPSYDDMFHARVHGGGPPPQNINDVRSMMNPRGLRRY